VPDHGEIGGLIETGLSTLEGSNRVSVKRTWKGTLSPGGRDSTYIVSSAIPNEATVADETQVEGERLLAVAWSYMCGDLTRGDEDFRAFRVWSLRRGRAGVGGCKRTQNEKRRASFGPSQSEITLYLIRLPNCCESRETLQMAV